MTENNQINTELVQLTNESMDLFNDPAFVLDFTIEEFELLMRGARFL